MAKACAAAGWDVDVEAAGDGWIADVLATRNGIKVAFEVQWPHQTESDYDFRTSRYRESGVHVKGQ